VSGPLTRMRQSRMFQVVVVYAGAAWVVLEVAGTLSENLGLPRWVFAAALVLLLVGFVIVLATAWVQSRPGIASRAEADEVPEAWELDPGDLVRALSRGRLPHLTWARALAGGGLAFLLLFGLAGSYVLIQDGGESFVTRDPGEAEPGLAIMPFAVSGEGLDVWREGMVDLLATNLDGVAGLRTINSRTILARWRERGVDAGADLAEVLATARATGATLALVGSAVRIGADVRLSAELHDLQRDRTLGTARVEGPEDSILTVIDRLSVDVVRRVLEDEDGSGPSVRSVTTLTTSSLPSLEAFLEGESLYRAGNFAGAVRAYERAVAADSGFAMPYYRLSHAVGWMEGLSDVAQAYGRQARALADRLPARDAALLRASDLALGEGRVEGIRELEAMSRRYPDDPEVWYELGEAYNHLGAQALVPVRAMSDAFETAIRLDSSSAPAYIHAIEAVASYGDTARLRVLVDGLRRYAPPGAEHVTRLDFMHRAMTGGAGIQDELERIPEDILWGLLINIDDASIGTEALRERIVREAVRRRDAGRMNTDPGVGWDYMAAVSFHNRGKVREALSLVDRIPALARALLLIRMRLDGLDVPRDLLVPPPGEDATALALGAVVAAERAEWDELDRRVTRFRAITEADTTLDDRGRGRRAGILEGLDAWRLWRQGEVDRAAPGLANAQASFSGFGASAAVNALFRRAAEHAFTELGRPADALPYALAQRADPFATFRAAALHEELGQVDAARNAYALVLDAWDEADADLSHVEVAQRRLQALSGEGAR
jgi:TolB-like protein/tetratricopeptide (TPR) repeat protein